MIAFAVDTSALMAVLNDEADAMAYRQAFHEADEMVVGTATLFEAGCVVSRGKLQSGHLRLEMLVERLSPTVVAFDLDQMAVARSAYLRFGRGSGHPASLNMGDCFAYALAMTRQLPLLFKGDDFIHTDIVPALKLPET
ncbi:type II toxin-antitoxin system VapC family toxin [Mesorhizobium sp. 1B3]|uniref:type II toxin-antitoxin system VapC family toxin n=1 Tax=Mesorhizobium sp. 1B3 TaxID=3243599 RepID=UPI003D972CA7